ncbi:hypothetical protein L3X38_012456 [Prunus dulcis]|uniref:Uncharacterized protein n=1 Tax=Prunus dulcis TaxID=3755 RepID=A0AAD4WJN2_PRUDU|nr:hypothetical protein L3X38_012456 [Prunus dulcis]
MALELPAAGRPLRESLEARATDVPNCIVYPEQEEGDSFEIRHHMLEILPTFRGLPNEDANIHIAKFITGSAVARYYPLWAWLHSHQPARFCFWELTKQLPRVVTHPGIAPASHSLNFGVLTTPKPVSSQKASYYEDARCAI